MRIFYDEMRGEFKRVLLKKGLNAELAEINATLFAQNSLDGIYTHGLNRFPRVIEYIDKGYINVNDVASKECAFGAMERWTGNMGMGPSNAKICMGRAVELAGQFGIGCVALGRTNHWMRGGAYGLLAADMGCVGICFTNTAPNMPAWGGLDNRIGNNPFIIAIPRPDSMHFMLDMAVSQYSYGAVEKAARDGKMLPVPGGYDKDGNLTNDPKLLWESRRALPVGFWKGSCMSMVLDLLAAGLAQGNTVQDIGNLPAEIACSQLFIAIAPDKCGEPGYMNRVTENTIEYIKASQTETGDGTIYYPNEMSYETREDNLKNGIPADEGFWAEVKAL